MENIPAPRVLSIFGAGSLASIIVALSVNGPASVCALVLIGFFHSIMFPTIFALSIKNLGPLTKRGFVSPGHGDSGGAVLPAIMGRISDATNIRTASIIPLVCYLYIFHFAVNDHRLGNTRSEEAPSTTRIAQES